MEPEVIASVPELVESANRAARQTVELHLIARGLFELIDAFRFRDVGAPIPAPGSADLPDEIRAHALEAMHAVATCRILAETAQAQSEAPAVSEELLDASIRAGDRRTDAEAKLRRLAQIGLGVAQHAYEDDDVELLERAATMTLFRPGASVPAAADGFGLVGSTRAELSVELAGMIARMLCDARPGSGFTLHDASGALLTIDSAPAGALHLIVGSPTTGPAHGRVLQPDGTPTRTVPERVVITELTASILDTLRAWGVDLAALHVDWALWRPRPGAFG